MGSRAELRSANNHIRTSTSCCVVIFFGPDWGCLASSCRCCALWGLVFSIRAAAGQPPVPDATAANLFDVALAALQPAELSFKWLVGQPFDAIWSNSHAFLGSCRYLGQKSGQHLTCTWLTCNVWLGANGVNCPIGRHVFFLFQLGVRFQRGAGASGRRTWNTSKMWWWNQHQYVSFFMDLCGASTWLAMFQPRGKPLWRAESGCCFAHGAISGSIRMCHLWLHKLRKPNASLLLGHSCNKCSSPPATPVHRAAVFGARRIKSYKAYPEKCLRLGHLLNPQGYHDFPMNFSLKTSNLESRSYFRRFSHWDGHKFVDFVDAQCLDTHT